jgi:hypothetical protein
MECLRVPRRRDAESPRALQEKGEHEVYEFSPAGYSDMATDDGAAPLHGAKAPYRRGQARRAVGLQVREGSTPLKCLRLFLRRSSPVGLSRKGHLEADAFGIEEFIESALTR